MTQMCLGNLYMTSAFNSALSSAVYIYEKTFREGGCKDYVQCLCLAISYFNLASPIKNVHNRNGLVLLVGVCEGVGAYMYVCVCVLVGGCVWKKEKQWRLNGVGW